MSEQTLYDRLGGASGIHAITEDIWVNHNNNEAVKVRYANSDPEKVKRLVFEFIASGTGGTEIYSGQDMLTAHTTMNISDQEFNAVVDDVLAAMRNNNVEEAACSEMLAIMWSLKRDIVGV